MATLSNIVGEILQPVVNPASPMGLLLKRDKVINVSKADLPGVVFAEMKAAGMPVTYTGGTKLTDIKATTGTLLFIEKSGPNPLDELSIKWSPT